MKKIPSDFQLQLRKINALPHPHPTPPSPHPIPTLLQSDLITLFAILVFVIFCKFLGCHGFGLFLCQAMALVVFPEKKIHKKNSHVLVHGNLPRDYAIILMVVISI